MAFIPGPAAAGPHRGGRGTTRRIVGRARAAAVVLLILPASAIPVLGAAPASAGGTSSLHTRLAAQEAKITAESTEIYHLTTAYQQALLQSTTLAQQVAADRNSLRTLRAAVASRRSALRQVAIRAYVDGVSTAPPLLRTDPAISLEYLTVASGDLNDAVDQLNLRQRQVGNDEVRLKQEEQAKQFALTNAEKTRRQVLAVAAGEQKQLNALQSRLRQPQTGLVSGARAPASPAQAPATQAAAQPTPARPTAARPTAARATAARATVPRGVGGGTEGPPVDNGLVRFVESQVSATPPTIAADSASPGGSTGAELAELRMCESGDDYGANTGNGFYGAYQLSQSTWSGLGYPGRPDLKPPALQDQAAARLVETLGWSRWPACSAALGL